MNRYLTSNDDETARHLDAIMLPTSALALLGDPEKMTLHGNRVRGLHMDVASHVQALSRLSRDETRNEAQRHIAAKEIGLFLNKRLTDAAAVLRQGAKALHVEAIEIADAKFNSALVSGNLEGDIRQFARELTSQPGGQLKLAALAASDITLAATLYRSPGFLVGIEDAAQHTDLKLAAVKKHVPDATSRLVESDYLTKTASRYDFTAKKMLTVWNDTIVQRAQAGRVDMPQPIAASI